MNGWPFLRAELLDANRGARQGYPLFGCVDEFMVNVDGEWRYFFSECSLKTQLAVREPSSHEGEGKKEKKCRYIVGHPVCD